jgi:hypothetical protein
MRFALYIAIPYVHYGVAIAMSIEVEWKSFKFMAL